MKTTAATPELSVIVPVLNEAATLPALFRTLTVQERVTLELVLSDGGSTDDTIEVAHRLGEHAPFPVIVVTGERGRGRQLNAGAAASSCATLLFLHADSHFVNHRALRSGLDLLGEEIRARGDERVAGHYPLRFARHDQALSVGYYFYECKARLDRRECTHGDQGLMLRRGFFAEVGPFDEALAMVAETRLAEEVRGRGKWLLFPPAIFTSARRFESEGLYERQVLNAIIMNFAAQGWETFFRELPAIYASHDRCGRIALAPMLRAIRRLIGALPMRERVSLWYATGDYVLSHAWQVPFFLDIRHNFRRGILPGQGKTNFLSFHDRHLKYLMEHAPGRLAATCLTWLWFRAACLHAGLKSTKEQRGGGE
jgi:rSAM/selenodomain-associated transferase 2